MISATEVVSGVSEKGNPEDWWRQPWLPEEMDKIAIKMSDFEEAVKMVQHLLKKEGFSSIPNETWENVGGYDNISQVFDHYIVRRIKYPEVYESFEWIWSHDFLLYGPPGRGKTLIAKAVANKAGANFVHIKGPELLSKYVGESELAVRTLFTCARACSPCILFFDEVDALTTKHGKEGGWAVERLLNQGSGEVFLSLVLQIDLRSWMMLSYDLVDLVNIFMFLCRALMSGV